MNSLIKSLGFVQKLFVFIIALVVFLRDLDLSLIQKYTQDLNFGDLLLSLQFVILISVIKVLIDIKSVKKNLVGRNRKAFLGEISISLLLFTIMFEMYDWFDLYAFLVCFFTAILLGYEKFRPEYDQIITLVNFKGLKVTSRHIDNGVICFVLFSFIYVSFGGKFSGPSIKSKVLDDEIRVIKTIK